MVVIIYCRDTINCKVTIVLCNGALVKHIEYIVQSGKTHIEYIVQSGKTHIEYIVQSGKTH